MNIETLTKQELKDYAETLGIEIGSRETVDEIRSKINAQGAIDGATPVTDSNTLAEAVDKKAKGGDELVKCMIMPGQDGDMTNAFVSINGTAMSIPRNKEVEIPKKYIDVLIKECYGYKVVQTRNEMTGKIETNRVRVPAYNIQLL